MAEQSHEQPPIRIIKKKSGHGGHHGGAWKVAYADFVTAMMALFIVLWILGQSEEVKSSVAGYFRNPIGKGEMRLGPKAAGPPRAEPERNPKPADDAITVLEGEAEELRMTIESRPELQELADQISIEVTPEGVRVEINESEKQPLFESGSARLSPKLVSGLKVFATQFAKFGSPIVIEGHTDSKPYPDGSLMTNWELSTHRAVEARRVMAEAGLDESQIAMIRGFADRKPRFADALDPRNRRISILLLSKEGQRLSAKTQSAGM